MRYYTLPFSWKLFYQVIFSYNHYLHQIYCFFITIQMVLLQPGYYHIPGCKWVIVSRYDDFFACCEHNSPVMTITCCFRVIAALQCPIAWLQWSIASRNSVYSRLGLIRCSCYGSLQPGTTTYPVVQSSNTISNAPLLSCNAPLLRCNDRKSGCNGHCTLAMTYCRLRRSNVPLQRAIAAWNWVIVRLQR